MSEDFQSDIDAVGSLAAVPAILDVICHAAGMGFAAVARVTPERWIACSVKDEIAVGLKPGSELKIETTICNEIGRSGEAVVIENVDDDPIHARHRTPLRHGFQSYISVPIVLKDGTVFGTLCAIDSKPAKLRNPQTIGMFNLFAQLIAMHLDANARLAKRELAAETRYATSQADLLEERHTAELREQFIAVLGHDLRNPLASIAAGTRLLAKEAQSDKAKTVVQLMQASVDRMAGLIDNVLDFARARLGGGWTLNLKEEIAEPIIAQVVNEARSALPQRRIELVVDAPLPVVCDRGRISQLLSNLVGNAITHGDASTPVRVSASTKGRTFEISVSNEGTAIPPGDLARLFMPFVRGAHVSEKGLGLGLYIASEIARAHGGALTASSSPAETRFTFRMPLNR
ncbi:MAG: GAF domain-containing sensor histidine kinase [Proteobacteria bacterium]|nr:GAF domain-containing sensor histidine kinase [Pseudomonadota bacterium]